MTVPDLLETYFMLTCPKHDSSASLWTSVFFSPHARTQQAALSCDNLYSEMAESENDTVAAGPRLVDKDDARSEIWKYFAYLADSEGKASDTARPVCRQCFKQLQTKGANTGLQNATKIFKGATNNSST